MAAERELLERAIECQRAALASMPRQRLYQRTIKLHLLCLVRVCWALHQPAEANRLMSEAANLSHGNPTDLYKVVCALALSVPLAPADKRQALAAEAVEKLKQAIAAGWNDAGKTGRDPDLATLRDRDDFRRLLAGLFDRCFPTDPIAK